MFSILLDTKWGDATEIRPILKKKILGVMQGGFEYEPEK
jgi:hypothetical protein